MKGDRPAVRDAERELGGRSLLVKEEAGALALIRLGEPCARRPAPRVRRLGARGGRAPATRRSAPAPPTRSVSASGPRCSHRSSSGTRAARGRRSGNRRALARPHPRHGRRPRCRAARDAARAVYLRYRELETAAERGLAGPHLRVAQALLSGHVLRRPQPRPLLIPTPPPSRRSPVFARRSRSRHRGGGHGPTARRERADRPARHLLAERPASAGKRGGAARRPGRPARGRRSERPPARGDDASAKDREQALDSERRGEAAGGLLRDLAFLLGKPEARGDDRRYPRRCGAARRGRCRAPDARGSGGRPRPTLGLHPGAAARGWC